MRRRVTPPRGGLELDQSVYVESVLLEDDVVDAVVVLLEDSGWTIESVAHAHERGDDIVAIKGGVRLRVEAKGAGSSKPRTKRYGLPFTRNQVGSHVGVAVVRALKWASRGEGRAAVAFPDNPHHRAQVDAIAPALAKVGVGIFFVNDNRRTRFASPWTL